MTDLKDRQTAFENKYAHDQEKLFRIEARASKRIGLWTAQEIGLTGDEAENYALSIVSHNLQKPGLGDVVDKISQDLSTAGKPTDAVANLLNIYLNEAETEIEAG